MRTKKIITLVLVLALALSAVSFGASASFSDIDENNANRTYYDLLAGLGIIKGYDDGTFKETNPVTREEAVAFIYRMANGNDNAMKGATAFPDVASDRWSSGYINWAVAKGIVAGYPDGTFKPTNTVTVAEMAKMMVVALGWPSNNYTFPYGFINAAQDFGVLDGVNAGNVDAACTRAMVSVITYNTLITDNRVEFLIVNGYPQKQELGSFISSGRFNAIKAEGYIVNGTSKLNAVSGMTKAGQVNIVRPAATGVTASDIIASYALNNAEDMIGREVTVWFKNSDDSTTLKNSSEIIALVPNTDEKIATVNMADISDVAADEGKIKIDGVKYDIAADDTDACYTKVTGNVDKYEAGNTNTILRVVYKEENADVSRVYAYTSLVNQIGKVASNGDVTLKAYGDERASTSVIDADNVTAYEGIAKDDIVYVAETSAVVGKAVASSTYTMTKADVVKGVSYTSSNKDGYVFGGTTYKLSKDFGTFDKTLGSSYDLTLSPTGFIKKIDDASTTTNKVYGVVTNYSSSKTGNIGSGTYTDLTMTVMTGDGVEKTYPVAKKANGAYINEDGNGNWTDYQNGFKKIAYQPVELSLNSEGTVTSFTVATTNNGQNGTYNKNTKVLTANSTDYLISDSSAIFSIEWKGSNGAFGEDSTATVTAVAPSKLGNLTDKAIVGMQAATSGTKSVKVVLFGADLGVSTSEKTGYVQFVEQTVNSKNDPIYSFKATIDGKVVNLFTESETVAKKVIDEAKKIVTPEAGTEYTPVFGEFEISGEELTSFKTAGVTAPTYGIINAISGNAITVKADSAEATASVLKTIKSDAKYYNLEAKSNGMLKEIRVDADKDLPTIDNLGEDTEIYYTVDASGDYAGMINTIYIVNK